MLFHLACSISMKKSNSLIQLDTHQVVQTRVLLFEFVRPSCSVLCLVIDCQHRQKSNECTHTLLQLRDLTLQVFRARLREFSQL
jgi:hypothetical protein